LPLRRCGGPTGMAAATAAAATAAAQTLRRRPSTRRAPSGAPALVCCGGQLAAHAITWGRGADAAPATHPAGPLANARRGAPAPALPARSPGYSGPRLAARPDLAGVSARQAAESRGHVVFDDGDARMAAFDAMDVFAACGGDGDGAALDAAAAGAEGAGGGAAAAAAAARRVLAWDADERALRSFNDLKGPRSLLQRMKRARLNRPTPIQRCGARGPAAPAARGRGARRGGRCLCTAALAAPSGRSRRARPPAHPSLVPPIPTPAAAVSPRVSAPALARRTAPPSRCCRRDETWCSPRRPAAARRRPTWCP
jgi:hypothetical protein